MLGVRFVDRVGKGIRTAPRDALVAGSIDEKQRGLAFGVHRAGDTAGAFVGLAAAAYIVWMNQGSAPDLSRVTFQIAVLVSIIPALLAVIVLAVGVREIPGAGDRQSAGAQPAGAGQRASRHFLLIIVLFTLGNSSDAFIILRGQERGLDVFQVMGMVLTFNFVYAVLAGPLGCALR